MADHAQAGQHVGSTVEHRLFVLVLLGKAGLGVIQLLTAIALYLGVMQYLPRLAHWVVAKEISGDPGDFLSTQILSIADLAPATDTSFYLLYFTAHGVLHLGVVLALLWRARWANQAAVLTLWGFVVYQMYEWLMVGGVMLLVLSAIDLVVIYLTMKEQQQQNRKQRI